MEPPGGCALPHGKDEHHMGLGDEHETDAVYICKPVFECSVLPSSCSLSKNLFDLSAQLPNHRHRSMPLSRTRSPVQPLRLGLTIAAPMMSAATITATVTAAATTTATTTATTQVPLPQRSRRH